MVVSEYGDSGVTGGCCSSSGRVSNIIIGSGHRCVSVILNLLVSEIWRRDSFRDCKILARELGTLLVCSIINVLTILVRVSHA